MLDLDIEQFWKDDELAHKDNCFSPDAPQVALGIRMSDECVFAELNEPGEPWGHTPLERRIELNKRYNDRAEKIVGKRLLREEFTELNPNIRFPRRKSIEEVFECRHVFRGGSNWVESNCDTPQKLEKLFDRVEKLNLKEFLLPPTGKQRKKEFMKNTEKSLIF